MLKFVRRYPIRPRVTKSSAFIIKGMQLIEREFLLVIVYIMTRIKIPCEYPVTVP